MALFLRGPGAEFIVGDIVERFLDDRECGVPLVVARSRLRRQALSSALAWWSPSTIIRRRRDARAAAEEVVLRLTASRAAPADGRSRTGIGVLTSALSELGPGLRGLIRSPTYTLAVGATLGLGIGAVATVFSVVDAVLLRPLPYLDPASLVTVGATRGPDGGSQAEGDGRTRLGPISWPEFDDIRGRTRSFAGIAAMESIDFPLSDNGDGPEVVRAARVSPDLFDVLGVSPALGRSFESADGSVQSDPVVMITFGAWQRRYGGDPNVVGSPVPRGLTRATIMGILPAEFQPPEAFFPPGEEPDLWIALPADHPRYRRRDVAEMLVVARLATGADMESTRTELQGVAAELAGDYPLTNRRPDGAPVAFHANALLDETVGSARRPLGVLFGAAGMLLLLAALNAGTMFLSRSLDRTRELSVRSALGAGRGRIVALLALEGMLLAALGGGLGLAVAWAGIEAFVRYAPASIPRLAATTLDLRVLAFAAFVSLGVGLAAGLIPALQTTRAGPWLRLQRSGRGASEPYPRVGTMFVAGQITAAVILLSGATLFFASFVNLRSTDPGFDPENLVSMEVDMEGAARSFPDLWTTTWAGWERALEALSAVPGVVAVAGTTEVPLRAPSWAPRILLTGDPAAAWREGIAGYVVSPGYLDLVGTRVVSGRGIDFVDGPDSEPVAVVNERFVSTQIPVGTDPVGLEMELQVRAGGAERRVRIVGVVENAVQARIEDGPRPAIYVPHTQQAAELEAVIRTSGAVEAVIPELRRAAAQFNPIVPLQDIRTLEARLIEAGQNQQFRALLVGAFALLAILLASAGLYASMTHTVSRRRKELAVRLAIGADRARILTMVLRQGMMIATVGVVVGVVGALVLARLLEGLLFEIDPRNPILLSVAAGVFLVVSVLACLVPARQATAVEPVSVLKGD
ncbi:MAG: ADOP family duplicated permease [Gemmatimonadota bacterium]